MVPPSNLILMLCCIPFGTSHPPRPSGSSMARFSNPGPSPPVRPYPYRRDRSKVTGMSSSDGLSEMQTIRHIRQGEPSLSTGTWTCTRSGARGCTSHTPPNRMTNRASSQATPSPWTAPTRVEKAGSSWDGLSIRIPTSPDSSWVTRSPSPPIPPCTLS